jgi:putative glutamine amidotransferase
MSPSVRAPFVGVTSNLFPAEDRRFYKHKELHVVESALVQCVHDADAWPVLLPVLPDPASASAYVERLDGLVLSGGTDIDPANYGEALANDAWAGQPERDAFEMALYRCARERGLPVLGVCRGMQLINVAEGGSLWQDLGLFRPNTRVHRSQELYDSLSHVVHLEPGSLLETIFGKGEIQVNTVHHQGVRALAPGLVPIALAPDGVIEAVIHRDGPFCLGIQWHPEWMQQVAEQRALIEAFVERVRAARDRRHSTP